MIEIEQLWALIDEHVTPLAARDLPLPDAVGCVIPGAVAAPAAVPPFDQSAMDGYAFPTLPAGPCRIAATLAAGSLPGAPLEPGTAARIFTGAAVPSNACFVAPQEDCVVEHDVVRTLESAAFTPGAHIRRQGAILGRGSALLPPGSRLGPGALALLASCGIHRVTAIPHPVSLHIATGSELIPMGAPAAPGRVHDSNGPMTQALFAADGLPLERRLLPDSRAELTAAARAFAGDLLLISGGSGPGDHDHTVHALEAAGFETHARRVNSRPGRPLIFATRGAQIAFGIPGNPLSHWVCHHAFVRHALARLAGLPRPTCIRVKPAPEPPSTGPRTWTLARVEWLADGPRIEPLRWLHSGDLTPLATANALLLDGGAIILPTS
jgi:molybdopterin molybdotransferase